MPTEASGSDVIWIQETYHIRCRTQNKNYRWMDKLVLIWYDVECLLSKESTVESYQNSYFACCCNSSLIFFLVVWHFTQEMLEGYSHINSCLKYHHIVFHLMKVSLQPHSAYSKDMCHGLLTRYIKLRVAHAPGMVLLVTDFIGNR